METCLFWDLLTVIVIICILSIKKESNIRDKNYSFYYNSNEEKLNLSQVISSCSNMKISRLLYYANKNHKKQLYDLNIDEINSILNKYSLKVFYYKILDWSLMIGPLFDIVYDKCWENTSTGELTSLSNIFKDGVYKFKYDKQYFDVNTIKFSLEQEIKMRSHLSISYHINKSKRTLTIQILRK